MIRLASRQSKKGWSRIGLTPATAFPYCPPRFDAVATIRSDGGPFAAFCRADLGGSQTEAIARSGKILGPNVAAFLR